MKKVPIERISKKSNSLIPIAQNKALYIML